jgi:hypothetical protein
MGCGESDSQFGETALMRAASNDHTDCVHMLIDAGADKDAKGYVRVGRCFALLPLFSDFLLTFHLPLYIFVHLPLCVWYFLTFKGSMVSSSLRFFFFCSLCC